MPLSRKDHLVNTSTPQSSKKYFKGKGNASQPLVGAHFSISGGLHEAVHAAAAYGCSALQMFTKNAMTWKERTVSEKEIEAFEIAKRETGITCIAAHAAYLDAIRNRDLSQTRTLVDRHLLRLCSKYRVFPYTELAGRDRVNRRDPTSR